MDSDLTRLTVFFEAPFWVGMFERFEGGTLSVCRIVFGAEPKDYDVLSYVLKNYTRLRFSPAVAAAVRQDAANPKRMQREIRRASSDCGVGTVTVRPLHGRQCLYCRTWRGRIVLGEKAAARVSGGFGVRYWGCP